MHAVEFAIYWDDDMYGTEPAKVLILGPDQAGNILEIIGRLDGDALYVFHAMRARAQFLELLDT